MNTEASLKEKKISIQRKARNPEPKGLRLKS